MTSHFFCDRTNVGYKVVTHSIVQSRTTEKILEALNMIKNWNKDWKPPFFLYDYSEAKFLQQSRHFLVLLSTFVISIVNKHGLGGQETTRMDSANTNKINCWQTYVLVHGHHLRNQTVDYLMMLIISNLSSPLRQNNTGVQQWLSKTWLCIPLVRDLSYTILYDLDDW